MGGRGRVKRRKRVAVGARAEDAVGKRDGNEEKGWVEKQGDRGSEKAMVD